MLNDKAILRRLFVESDLVIKPILSLKHQLGSASLDIRLGTEFLSQRVTSLIQVDPLAPREQIELDTLKTVEYFTISAQEPYVLHPGDFVLASTFEYIRVPTDLAVRLEGRSSWARKGLQVHATAGFIDPGFRGLITFELSNVSTMPIPLYPMVRIGQLSFYDVGDPLLSYGGKDLHKYQGNLTVTGSLSHRDPEWEIIKSIRSKVD